MRGPAISLVFLVLVLYLVRSPRTRNPVAATPERSTVRCWIRPGQPSRARQCKLQNPVSHYTQTAKTDNQGNFEFVNIPYNNYHLSATASGFQSAAQDVDVRSPLPVEVKIGLKHRRGHTQP